MENQRVLAYKLATVVNIEELDEISGGNIAGPIIIPTLRITGRPLLPDSLNDTD